MKERAISIVLAVLIVTVIWWACTRGDETANPDDPGDDPGPH